MVQVIAHRVIVDLPPGRLPRAAPGEPGGRSPSGRPAGGPASPLLEEAPRDDEPLDLARPLVDPLHPLVPHHPLDGVLAGVAVAAVELDGGVADAAGGL